MRIVRFSIGGAVAALLALPLASGKTYPLSAGEIHLEARAAWRGRTVVSIPPLGSVEAQTHHAPLRITISPETIDVPGFERLLKERPTRRELEAGLSQDRDAVLVAFGLRLLLLGTIAGALSLGILRGRKLSDALAACLAGALLPAAMYVAAMSQFDPGSFKEPTFTGALTRAPQVIGPADELAEKFEEFRRELNVLGSSAFEVYRFLQEQSAVPPDAVRILHIGDIHLNPVSFDIAFEVARQFHVNAIFDTGDLTAQGTELEASFTSRIERFRIPYVFVRGNHDSPATEDAVRIQPNAVVLDFTETQIEGIRIYGAGDPLFTPGRSGGLTNERQRAEKERFSLKLLDSVTQLPTPPDVMLVHDRTTATELFGRIPLVIAGHGHKWFSKDVEGTRVIQVASSGGAGLETFTFDTNIPIGMEILYFDRSNHELLALDRIEVRGPRQEFRISRIQLPMPEAA